MNSINKYFAYINKKAEDFLFDLKCFYFRKVYKKIIGLKNIYFVSQNVYFACAAGEMPNVQKLSPFATQNIDYQKHRRCLWEIYFVDLGQCGKYILFPQNVYFARAAGEIPNV